MDRKYHRLSCLQVSNQNAAGIAPEPHAGASAANAALTIAAGKLRVR